MKIIRIKKTFRKYKEFWYNGMAGQIFFATQLNKDEWIVHDFNCTQLGLIPHQNHSSHIVLKRHAEVVGRL